MSFLKSVTSVPMKGLHNVRGYVIQARKSVLAGAAVSRNMQYGTFKTTSAGVSEDTQAEISRAHLGIKMQNSARCIESGREHLSKIENIGAMYDKNDVQNTARYNHSRFGTFKTTSAGVSEDTQAEKSQWLHGIMNTSRYNYSEKFFLSRNDWFWMGAGKIGSKIIDSFKIEWEIQKSSWKNSLGTIFQHFKKLV